MALGKDVVSEPPQELTAMAKAPRTRENPELCFLLHLVRRELLAARC